MPPGERITRREWRWVVAFAALVLMITAIPYLVAWRAQGDDWRFTGSLFGVDDSNAYLGKMRLGASGHWLATLRTTSEPHDGAFVYVPYLLLGHLARLVSGGGPVPVRTLIAVFHGARLAFDLALLLTIYRFVAVFVRRPATRRLALVLIVLGGGLGWLLTLLGMEELFGSLPVDLIVPEGYTFLILFGLPHLALARTGLLLGFLCLFSALRRGSLRDALVGGACWAVMGLAVPFYVAVVYALLGAWGLAAWLRARCFPRALFGYAIAAALIPLPLLAYNAWVFAANDVFAQWAAQNRLPSPHPLHYALGYAVLALPAARAIGPAWRRGARRVPFLLLVSWVIAVPVLIYLPVNVQRRLAEGVLVPLGILAALGLERVAPRRRALAQGAVLALALPTAGMLWLGGLVSALSPARPIFRPQAEMSVMQALDAQAPRDAVVLSARETGNLLPVYTDLIAYVGHGPETLHADEKEARVAAFLRGELDPASRAALLAEIDYVLVGPLERAGVRGDGWQAGLREIASSGAGEDRFVAYEVVRD